MKNMENMENQIFQNHICNFHIFPFPYIFQIVWNGFEMEMMVFSDLFPGVKTSGGDGIWESLVSRKWTLGVPQSWGVSKLWLAYVGENPIVRNMGDFKRYPHFRKPPNSVVLHHVLSIQSILFSSLFYDYNLSVLNLAVHKKTWDRSEKKIHARSCEVSDNHPLARSGNHGAAKSPDTR